MSKIWGMIPVFYNISMICSTVVWYENTVVIGVDWQRCLFARRAFVTTTIIQNSRIYVWGNYTVSLSNKIVD